MAPILNVEFSKPRMERYSGTLPCSITLVSGASRLAATRFRYNSALIMYMSHIERFLRVTAFYICCQSVPFTLLVIHFLYRYWSVRRAHLITLFSNKLFLSSLVLLTVCIMVLW